MASQLPSHISPRPAATSADAHPVSHLSLEHQQDDPTHTSSEHDAHEHQAREPPPPSLLSSLPTPSASGTSTPARAAAALRSSEAEPEGIAVDTANDPRWRRPGPLLLEALPEVQCVVRARIPTVAGAEMFLHLYANSADSKEHLAIVFSDSIRSASLDAPVPGETERDRMIRGAYVGRLHPGREVSYADGGGAPGPSQAQAKAPLVRIHSECYTGETAWSARCDCGEQLDEAARLMSLPGGSGGVIVYLRQEGRGIGLGEKLKAYNLQDLGSDTVEANRLLRHPADARSYGLATAMLVDLGLGGERGIRLLTNNPDKIRAVEGPHREVVVRERVPMVPLAWRTGGARGIRSSEVEGYLQTKIGKMGHMLG